MAGTSATPVGVGNQARGTFLPDPTDFYACCK